MSTRRELITGWLAVLLWTIALGSIAFSLISLASIGLFGAPFALLITLLISRWAHAWPEALLGGLLGSGTLCLVIAYLNRNYVPCPATSVRLAPGQNFSCGGFDPTPWLVIGLLLVIAGIAGFMLFTTARNRYDAASKNPS